MSHFILNIPQQIKLSQDQFELHTEYVKKKISVLPMANQVDAIQQIFDLLYQLNRQQIDTTVRYQIVELLRPPVIELYQTIRRPYIRNPLPLSTDDLATAYQIQTLLTEMAFAYKALIIELLVSDTDDDEINDTQIQHAIYYAIIFLSKLLVECYQIYSPLPENTWHELHHIYLLSEGFSLQNKLIKGDENNSSITQAYLSISLLGLANPYHLMQSETIKIYEQSHQWASLCSIAAIGDNTEGFIANFDSDAPARFVKYETIEAHPKEGRIIDLSKAQQKLHELIKEKSALSKHHDIKRTTLSERAELGMYLRLKRSWGRRSQRLTSRNLQRSQLQATIGLSSCHYLISNNEPFQPEIDELNLHKYLPANPSKNNRLSILPDTLIPWQKDKLKESRQENFHISRQSNFNDKYNNRDVWSATHQANIKKPTQKKEAPEIITVNCIQNDESSGGLSISCEINDNIQARVGELIALEHKKGEKTFKICVLRWLKTNHHNDMEMGISFVADSAHAIAIKAVSGAGQGGDYFRGLFTPDKNPRENPTTLITPSALYDTSTTLLVNIKKDMFHVRLTHLLESSTSYSRFRFEITDYYENDDIPLEYVT